MYQINTFKLSLCHPKFMFQNGITGFFFHPFFLRPPKAEQRTKMVRPSNAFDSTVLTINYYIYGDMMSFLSF